MKKFLKTSLIILIIPISALVLFFLFNFIHSGSPILNPFLTGKDYCRIWVQDVRGFPYRLNCYTARKQNDKWIYSRYATNICWSLGALRNPTFIYERRVRGVPTHKLAGELVEEKTERLINSLFNNINEKRDERCLTIDGTNFSFVFSKSGEIYTYEAYNLDYYPDERNLSDLYEFYWTMIEVFEPRLRKPITSSK